MDINFRARADYNFKDIKKQIRAFLYTDYSIEPHNHDFYEMNIILGGSGVHCIENARVKVKPGDVYVIPPLTAHAYYETENLDVYHILMHKNFILSDRAQAAEMPGFLHFVEIEPFLRRHGSETAFLHLSASQLLALKGELAFIEDGGLYDRDELVPLIHYTMWKILYWLSYLLYLQIESGEKSPQGTYDYAVIRALEYIHHNFGEKITVETLCEKSFLSRSTFLRSFSQMCGCTPIKYLNSYRCKKALEMLENTSMSKTAIANACGFYDLSHLERALKAM